METDVRKENDLYLASLKGIVKERNPNDTAQGPIFSGDETIPQFEQTTLLLLPKRKIYFIGNFLLQLGQL